MLIPLVLILQALYWSSEARVPLPASSSSDLKLIGGKDINITEAPYQVSIHRRGHYVCGGTIIANNVVLTAGHCVHPMDKNNATFYYVRAGSSFIDHDGDVYPIQKILVHPYYVFHSLDNDIAIMWLSKPIEFSDKAAAIEMKASGEEVKDMEFVQITGWGYTRDDMVVDYPTQLQRVQIQTGNSERCAKNLDMTVSLRMMCAGVLEGGKGYCWGDTGSPLVHKGKLAGIASMSVESCGDYDHPYEVYAKVSALRDWIDENIKN